jgi:hypothetical protein
MSWHLAEVVLALAVFVSACRLYFSWTARGSKQRLLCMFPAFLFAWPLSYAVISLLEFRWVNMLRAAGVERIQTGWMAAYAAVIFGHVVLIGHLAAKHASTSPAFNYDANRRSDLRPSPSSSPGKT